MKKIKKIIKTVLILTGSIILLIYCLPLVAGILNIGNIFGICVGIAFILSGRFLDKIIELWRKRLGKAIISVVCVVAVAGFGIFGATLFNVLYNGVKFANGDETLIVLGCQVRGDKPSIALKNRTMVGVEYLKSYPETKAILCGGQGNGESISEAECMKRIMLENGIDENRIFVEDKSTSTEENLKFAKDIINENHLGSSVVVATSEYHCYRAMLIAESVGLDATSIPAYGDRFSRPTFYTREVFGVWLQYIKA